MYIQIDIRVRYYNKNTEKICTELLFLYGQSSCCDYPHDIGKRDIRHRKSLRQSIIEHASHRDQVRAGAHTKIGGTTTGQILLLNC